MPRKDNPGPLSAQQQQDLVSEGIDNFELPKSIVQKIAKSALPENAKLQKEVILSLVKGSTVFINYLAATAHDVAQSKQHKSISASDVLKALELIDLSDLVEPLTAELQVYRDQGKSDKSGGTRRASTASSAITTPNPVAADGKQSAPTGNIKGKGRASNVGDLNPSVSAGPNVQSVETLPPPFTSVPLVHQSARLHSSNQENHGDAEDLSAAINKAHASAEEEMEVEYAAELNEATLDASEDVDMNDDEAGEEEEELADIVEIEAQEMREDGKGVEQRGTAAEHRV
ncbi:hypothetical protein D9757_006567 [Collybiopsis confluens]|uniref:DNA polymerase epsilon subunit D n=1 Tax=Collybiopsis confluens TaxID=2823264 RepID=A0A8H5HQB1_9AGAR|nr:hypothetical protein D9757_006567 [Collybiopsis confluens]